jgi:mannose-6-phosphate isomerase-like protein (cupin superfamily)
MSVRKAHIGDITAYSAVDGQLRWHPVRHHLGVRSFGTNAYTARDAGDMVVEPHDEDEFEELYVVVSGAARFTVDDETFDAPQGTLVLVTPPSRREATATEAGTTVLAVGGVPGRAFEVSDWETRWLSEAEPAA